jgi:hypothetical protein
MKNFILLLFVALFVVSCTKKDSEVTLSQNYFKINTDRYDLDKAYYTIDSINKFTQIVIVSSGLTFDANLQDFKGSGNVITFDFGDISSVLKAGSYYTPRGFYSGVVLNYNYSTQSGIDYEMKETLPGKLLITNTNSNYNIQFEFTLEGGQVVTGQYTGTVKKERF